MTWMERIIVVLAVALYVALTVVQMIYFGAPFGASAAPDLRMTGYSAQQVRDFLDAIGPEGRAAFFGVFRNLDTLFPPVLAMTLVIVFKALKPEFGKRAIGLFSLLALSYLAADLIENKFLGDLEHGPDFVDTALAANMMTQVKYGILGVIVLCLLAAALTGRKART